MNEHVLTLIDGFIRGHTEDAARVLEGRPLEEFADLLALVPADLVAVILATMELSTAANGLERLEPARGAAALTSVPPARAVALARAMREDARRRVLAIASLETIVRRPPERG